MDNELKQRLIGAAVLITLAVIFVPMILDGINAPPEGTTVVDDVKSSSESAEFSSRIIPLEKPQKILRAQDPNQLPLKDKNSSRSSKPQMPMVGLRQGSGVVTAVKSGAVKTEKTAKPKTKSVKKSANNNTEAAAVANITKTATSRASEVKPRPKSKIVSKPRKSTTVTRNSSRQSTITDLDNQAWVVQLGSFATRLNADKMRERLKGLGFPAFVETIKGDDGTLYRVRIGPEIKRERAIAIKDRLKKVANIDGIVLRFP